MRTYASLIAHLQNGEWEHTSEIFPVRTHHVGTWQEVHSRCKQPVMAAPPSATMLGTQHSWLGGYYQCRRLNLRYRGADGKPVFCHSLNNTVVAGPRILIPILEVYQNKDGSVTVPNALRPYMNGQDRIGG